MSIISILETLATSAHYRISIPSLIESQPDAIQSAFFSRDSKQLKEQLGDVINLADRDRVVQVSKQKI